MSACAPITRTRSVSGASTRRRSCTSAARVASIERNSMWSFGAPAIGSPFRNAPPPRDSRPLLVRAEVVDVAEEDVVDRVALGDRDREAEVRDPALGVLRAVDRVDEHRVPARRRVTPISSETMRTSSRSKCRSVAVSAASSSAAVTSPPSPCRIGALALLAARASPRARSFTSATAARHSSSQGLTAERGAGRRSASGRRTSTSAASSRRARRTPPPARPWARGRGTRPRPRRGRRRRPPPRRTGV